MRDFQFYVTDDRYEARSLLLVTTMSETDARRTATRILADPHHHAVEVWERGERVFALRGDEVHAGRFGVAVSST